MGITNEFLICAGDPKTGADTCQGDSGGPLSILDRSTRTFTLLGIVSGGSGCGNPNLPGLYSHVIKELLWIRETAFPTRFCNTNNDCSESHSCFANQCIDPCNCGVGAICKVSQRIAACFCPAGYRGNPFSHCSRGISGPIPSGSVDPCVPNPCGDNSKCKTLSTDDHLNRKRILCELNPMTTPTPPHLIYDTIENHNKHVVCYYATWAFYREVFRGHFTVDDVDPKLCSELVLAYMTIDNQTHKIASINEHFDIKIGGFKKALALRDTTPSLKVTVAIGGWSAGSVIYSNMVSSVISRRVFIQSVVEFLRKWHFDGISLHWNYPGTRGGVPSDKSNFVLLAKELRTAFDFINTYSSTNWTLSCMFPHKISRLDVGYDIPNLVKYFDFIHVQTFDYYGHWSKNTGLNAPLYSRQNESESDRTYNVNYTINYLINRGVPPQKMVLGLAAFGRGFKILKGNETRDTKMKPNVGVLTNESDIYKGPYTNTDGFIGYNEICLFHKEGGWMEQWQDEQQAPFMYKDDVWVGYDNPRSLAAKVEYAYNKELAGVMVWSLDTDDFMGDCAKDHPFQLMRSINSDLTRLHIKDQPYWPTGFVWPIGPGKANCNKKEVECTLSATCKPKGHMCDKNYDCLHGEDEDPEICFGV